MLPTPHHQGDMLRVLLVNDTEKPIGELRQALVSAGYQVVGEVRSGRALLRAVEAEEPDVVIVDVDSPSRDTLEQLSLVHQHAPRPVVMFSADGDDQLIRSAVGAGVTAYIVDGISPGKLAPIINVALAKFDHEAGMRRQLVEVQQLLEDRKLVDRAKALLMDKRGMSEAQAYAALRQQSMKQGAKLVEVARRLLAMADIL